MIGAEVPFAKVLEAGDLSHGFIETDVRLRPEQVEQISGAYEGSTTRARNVFDQSERLHAGISLSRVTFDKALARLPQTLRLQFVQQSQDMVPGLLLSRGCDAHCTYCAIPEAVGPLKSLPLETVVDNFSKMLARGQSIVSLIATDVGAYGVDRGSSVLELLHKLFAFSEPFKLIINDFHPIWVIRYGAALRDLFVAHADRIDYIVIPTQSGSDRILRLMGRSHSAEDAKKALLALKEAVPGIQIGTHIMVGFPGESKEDFNRTIDFVRTVDFSYLKVFRYDDRPNIASARLQEKVSDNIKRRRLMRLLREFPMLVK
jgi:tRNA A37 methylthiotransferase MiaB